MNTKSKYTKEDFEKAVMTSSSIREVLIKLGVAPKGGNYKVFYSKAKKFKTDISSFINPSSYGVEKEKRDCINDAQIIKATKDNISYQSILDSFGLSISGTNNKWIRSKITKLILDTSHFLGQGHLKNKTHNWSKKTPLENILVENSSFYTTSAIKKRLIKEGLLSEKCDECGITHWSNRKLSLHLDHINGINTDYRIGNLRLLCPNCHSLTPTYCRKKLK